MNFDARSINTVVQDDTILSSPNQFEFLVSITVHPFPHRRQERGKLPLSGA
jgi:hypothetical protein